MTHLVIKYQQFNHIMKGKFCIVLVAAGMLAACTENGGPAIESQEGEQIIRLKVSSAGDGLSTRAGRDLFSEEATQAIENVKLVIVNDNNEIVSQTTVGRWSDVATDFTTNGRGKETTIMLQGSDKVLAEGTYKILAYGYSTLTDYQELPDQIGQTEKGEIFESNQILTFAGGSGKLAEEIFAGEGTLTVDAEKSATGNVTLHRQVAGTFGYFKNIPYEEGADKLVLKSSANINTKIVLGNFISSELSGNGANTSYNVVNGTGANASDVIYTINLSDWFGEIKKSEGKNVIDASSWNNPYAEADVNFEEGSVFGGTFLIPFAGVYDKNSFVLELQDAENKVLRTWNIKLSPDDSQVGSHILGTWDADEGKFIESIVTETVSSYSVLRNHLYSVGSRGSKNPTTPGTGTDIPQDLNRDQTLTLQVNDNWEVIHKMELD